MIEIFFWILLLLWFVGAIIPESETPYYRYGKSLLLLVLFILVGLTIYHNPLTK